METSSLMAVVEFQKHKFFHRGLFFKSSLLVLCRNIHAHICIYMHACMTQPYRLWPFFYLDFPHVKILLADTGYKSATVFPSPATEIDRTDSQWQSK